MLTESWLFSGSGDSSIICWDTGNGAIIRTFQGHTNYVFALQVLGNDLYSGAGDGNVIKWNVNDGKIIRIFPPDHKGRIRSLALRDGAVFSGAEDTFIIRWNTTTGSLIFMYTGRQKIVSGLVLWKTFVISGGDDGQIKFWDVSIDSFEPSVVLHDHTDTIGSVLLYESTLFSASSDKTVRQWNLTDLQCLKILFGEHNFFTVYI